MDFVWNSTLVFDEGGDMGRRSILNAGGWCILDPFDASDEPVSIDAKSRNGNHTQAIRRRCKLCHWIYVKSCQMSDIMHICYAPHPQVPTPYIIGCFTLHWFRTLSMFPKCFPWCGLRMPWGSKKKSTEMGLPEVSAHLCCTIPLSHSCFQKLESNPAIVPATTFAENVVEPRPDEVRCRFTCCDLSDVRMDSGIARKLTERCSHKNRLCSGHRERGSNAGSICSFSDPSSVSERSH